MSEDAADHRPTVLCIEGLGIEVFLHVSWLQSSDGAALLRRLRDLPPPASPETTAR